MTLNDLIHVRAEVLEELEGLEEVVNLLQKRLNASTDMRKAPDDPVLLRGIAGMLQDYYSGVERVFKRVAVEIDDRLPKGDSWHKDLLAQMKRVLPGIRPRVIADSTFASLDELRTFRHLVANIYGYNLIPERVLRFAASLPGLQQSLRADVLYFLDALQAEAEQRIERNTN